MSRWERWSNSTTDKKGFSSFLKENNPSAAMGPAERARALGLQSNGKGGYIDPTTGQLAARTVNGELIFYDTNSPDGGAVSDGEGGQKLVQQQPSWADPLTGMLTTPPANAETPSEIAAIPDPVPATAPEGYNSFMQKKKMAAYQQNQVDPQPARMTPDEAEEQEAQAQQADPGEQQAFAAESRKTLRQMFEAGPGAGAAERMAKAHERMQQTQQKDAAKSAQLRAKAVESGGYDVKSLVARSQGLQPGNHDRKAMARDMGRGVAPQPAQTDNVQSAAQPSAIPQKTEPLGPLQSQFRGLTGNQTSTAQKESASLFTIMDALRNGNRITDDNMLERVKSAAEYYGIPEDKAKELVQSGRSQTEALEKYIKKKGIDPEKLKRYRFGKVGGTDSDIPEDARAENLLDDFHEKLWEVLGKEGKEQIIMSNQKDAYNPTDIFAYDGDATESIKKALFGHLEGLSESSSMDEKRNAMKLISQSLQGLVGDGSMLPMSLKQTNNPDVAAKSLEQNYRQMTPESIREVAMSILSDVGMNINLTDNKKGEGGPIDFGNNELSFQIAMRNAVESGDSEQLEDIFAQYYLLGNTVNQNRWMQLKNESKPLIKQKEDSSTAKKPFAPGSEKFGSIPVQMLTEHLEQMRNLPEGADGDYMMGMEDIFHPSKEEVESMYPVGKNGKRTKSNQKKYEEAIKQAGQKSGSQFRDFNEDEIEYYGQMLEDILEQNEANKMTPELPKMPFGKAPKSGPNKGVQKTYQRKNGVNVDIDPTVGNRNFKKGEMRDYMRAMFDTEKAIRMARKDPSKIEDAQKLIEPYFGEGHTMEDYGDRFSQNTRNALSRIAVARQLQTLYNNGNLQRVMSQALMQGQKVSFDEERPGFPFLKLGAESDLDPESYGLRGEDLEWSLDTNLIF